MIIGFLGTGVITEAIIRGLYDAAHYEGTILVSRRSEERSQRLSETYPNVRVVDQNQELAEQSDWIVVSVLPEQVSEVLSELSIRQDQKVVSLAAGVSLDELRAAAAPATDVVRVIPMPPIEHGLGPVALCPPDDATQALFHRIGTCVAVSDENQFNLFGAASALMADFYDQVSGVTQWMNAKGLDLPTAASYTTALYHALADLTVRQSPETLHTMSADCQTPGGLNAQFLSRRNRVGANQSLIDGLEDILNRLESATD